MAAADIGVELGTLNPATGEQVGESLPELVVGEGELLARHRLVDVDPQVAPKPESEPRHLPRSPTPELIHLFLGGEIEGELDGMET